MKLQPVPYEHNSNYYIQKTTELTLEFDVYAISQNHIYIHVYIYTCVYMYMYVYIYIYIHKGISSHV